MSYDIWLSACLCPCPYEHVSLRKGWIWYNCRRTDLREQYSKAMPCAWGKLYIWMPYTGWLQRDRATTAWLLGTNSWGKCTFHTMSGRILLLGTWLPSHLFLPRRKYENGSPLWSMSNKLHCCFIFWKMHRDKEMWPHLANICNSGFNIHFCELFYILRNPRENF